MDSNDIPTLAHALILATHSDSGICQKDLPGDKNLSEFALITHAQTE
jgi:hypothetical protein